MEPRLGSNPVRFVEKVKTHGARDRVRRAATEDELQRLIIAGGLRGVVYLFAARTGIRRGELGKIEWRDVHLDATQPFVMVRAAVSKNRRQTMQPLSPDAVEALEYWCGQNAMHDGAVFAKFIPRMEQYRRDLEAAGICYRNLRGEYLDFHALRTTFGTMLTVSGVGERTVMELMRHSDMRLTAKVYTDANMLPVSDAMASLMRHAAQKRDTQIRRTKSSQSRSRRVRICPAKRRWVAVVKRGQSGV